MRTIGLPAATRLVALALGALLALAAGPALAAQQPRGAAKADGGYIVLLESSVKDAQATTEGLERKQGFRARLRFRRVLRGFSARLSDAQVAELRADPEVASVTPDRPVKALEEVDLLAGDSAPEGVRRLGAGTAATAREASTANVAVIDSGIDLSHPDLNAADGVNCVAPGTPAQDDDGHGTHVAGTIAARNDGRGVVGVAPGTKAYAAKVLDADGKGTVSQVLCGIDWVTATRTDGDPSNDIAVANLSLGGFGDPVRSCTSTADPLHRGICASTRAGVTYVVAAGNDGWSFDSPTTPDLPAAYPEVLTVTAMSDSDGAPGAAGGAPSCSNGDGDDRFAGFSNYATTSAGAAHTVAGPGVCIRSTWLGGGYAASSGTSMASPHIAGAVALCLGEGGRQGPCAGLSPAAIMDKIREDASKRAVEMPTSGFFGDPTCAISGRHFGFLGWSGVPGGAAAAAQVTAPGAALCALPVPSVVIPAATPLKAPPATPATTSPRGGVGTPVSSAPAVDRTAPTVTISVSRQRLERVLGRGLGVTLRCSEGCLAAAELWLPGRTAKRVGLSKGRPKRIARRSALRLAAGTRRGVVLKLSRSSRRRLASLGRVVLRVEVPARDGAGNRRTTIRRVSIRR